MSWVRDGGTVLPARLNRIHLSRRVVWLLPAVCAAVVTGYLAWGAWVSAAHRQWLYQTQAWWRAGLRPGAILVPLVLVALWLVALSCYWWPRRLQRQLAGLTGIVAMGVIGGGLAPASLALCRGRGSGAPAGGWGVNPLFGHPPAYPARGCTGPPPPAP